VVAAITPYNFPLLENVMKLGPALAAGNAVVLKPSPFTPYSALLLAEAAEYAELPAGALNVLTGGADTGARGLSGHVEKEWTLDVARHVASRLADAGVRVLLTRETDSTTPLEGRPAFCLAHGGDLFVSIHFNSGGPTANGIETYCLTPAGHPSTDDANARHRNDAQAGNRWDERNAWLARL